MRAVATASGWVVAVLLVFILASRPTQSRLVVGEVRQDVQFEPLSLVLTNQPIVLWEIANTYHTAPGWIVSSNDRIWAGLADRVWSAPYTVHANYKHTVSVWAGAGVGISYTRTLFDRYTIGGMLLCAESTPRVLVGAGYKW